MDLEGKYSFYRGTCKRTLSLFHAVGNNGEGQAS